MDDQLRKLLSDYASGSESGSDPSNASQALEEHIERKHRNSRVTILIFVLLSVLAGLLNLVPRR